MTELEHRFMANSSLQTQIAYARAHPEQQLLRRRERSAPLDVENASGPPDRNIPEGLALRPTGVRSILQGLQPSALSKPPAHR